MILEELTVESASDETPLVRRLTLGGAAGGALPGWAPGAHLTLRAPGVGRRKFSLINAAASETATSAPLRYTLGIRRDGQGGGGSQWAHSLKPGDIIQAEPPENDFPLPGGDGAVVLIAGGIGVTPLISMAAALKAAGRPFRFIYAARSREDFAFLDDIRALSGNALTLHADDEAGVFYDIAALLGSLRDAEPVCICGPKPMLKAAVQESRRLGWPEGRLRFELFYTAAAEAAPQPAVGSAFEVEIKGSGQVFTIPPDKTILAVLLEAGLDPLHDCGKGECGVCQTNVIAGTPDHRDSILSEAEKAAGKMMQICVSRSKSPRLVLDI